MADNWVQNAVGRMAKKGTIGSFKRSAKSAGISTMSFAKQEVQSPTASTKMKRKAQFAINANKGR